MSSIFLVDFIKVSKLEKVFKRFLSFVTYCGIEIQPYNLDYF